MLTDSKAGIILIMEHRAAAEYKLPIEVFQIRHLTSGMRSIISPKVYVTSKEGIQRLQSGCEDTIPIGFDRDNVFVFNGEPLPDQPDWSKIEKWE